MSVLSPGELPRFVPIFAYRDVESPFTGTLPVTSSVSLVRLRRTSPFPLLSGFDSGRVYSGRDPSGGTESSTADGEELLKKGIEQYSTQYTDRRTVPGLT